MILDKKGRSIYDDSRYAERCGPVDILKQLQAHYEKYDETAVRVKAEAKGMGGIWGMGYDPKNHPAHLEFYNGVAGIVAEFLSGCPDSAATAEAAKYILAAADLRRKEESYWFSYAAQSHVIAMIPYMTAGDCKALADWYDTRYTKLERMPLQRDLYKKLRKAAK